jgi:hypothetical protein
MSSFCVILKKTHKNKQKKEEENFPPEKCRKKTGIPRFCK